MPNTSERITQLLISARWPLLGLAVLLAALAARPSTQVAFDQSIENMFAADDPLLPPYRHLKRVFGGDEIILLVYEDADLLNPDRQGLRRVGAISRRCEQVAGVRGVLSLDRLRIGSADVLTPGNPVANKLLQLFENYTHSRDGKTAVVVCMLEPSGHHSHRATIDALREIANSLPDGLAAGMLAGEPVLVADAFRYVQHDGDRLGWWSAVLLSLTFILCFRSLRWVIIPLAVVQLTLVWTRAALAVSGLKLSMVSSMLTAIVTVVGVATVAHIVVRYRHARGADLPPRDALARTGRLLAAPILFACVTDAMGFAALMVARVGPVRDFGLMMAIGSLFVLLAVPVIVPGICLIGVRNTALPLQQAGRFIAALSALTRFACRRPRWIAAVSALLIVGGLGGMSRLRIESDFTKNFRRDSDVIRSYRFVEDRLDGAGAFDVVLPAPEQLDWAYLRRVLKLEARLRNEVTIADNTSGPVAGLTKVLSLADAIAETSPIKLEKVPLNALRQQMINVAFGRMQTQMPAFYDALYGADPEQPAKHFFRITLRARERQRAEQKRQILAEVERIVSEEFPSTDTSHADVTGFYVLLTHLVSSLLHDQWAAFLVAIVGMAAIMLVAFRSFKLTTIALLPNALPIVIVIGTLGWSGIAVNMGAAMIAAVSLGLSIDGSIHYLTFFRRARLAGMTVVDAIMDVERGVGPAMAFATLALMIGFSVLCTSEFLPTVYFGFLVSLSMLGGLLGNLILLPALLMLCERDARNSGQTGAGVSGQQPAH